MARNARLLAGVLVALCLAAGAAGSAAGQALPEDSQLIEHWNGAAWTQTPSQSPHGGNYLAAAAAFSASDVWAVGSYVKATQNKLNWFPLAEHWKGTGWTAVVLPTPNKKVESELSAVAGSSAKDIWAVGSIDRTLIEHWNGRTWKIVPSLKKKGSSLAGVAAVSRRSAWAVGSFQNARGQSRTLIERWNGSSWRRVRSPNPSGSRGNDALWAVTARSARNVWAVGDYNDGGRSHTLVLHWNGSHWKRVASPSPGSRHGNTLSGVVAIGGKDVWAVGSYHATKTVQNPLAEHWDGNSWRRVPVPSPAGSTFNLLESVTAVSHSDVWAVGTDGPGKTLAEHWDGTSWQVVPTVDPSFDAFLGIAAVSATDIWAVGLTSAV
jgi:hypothetical protein